MTVESHVLKKDLLFKAVFLDKRSRQLSLSAKSEIVNFYLLSKVHVVLRHFLIHRLLCAPINSQLLVTLLFVEIFNLLLRESPFFHSGKIPVKRLAVNADLFRIIVNHRYIFVRVRDTYIGRGILYIWFTVVVMA